MLANLLTDVRIPISIMKMSSKLSCPWEISLDVATFAPLSSALGTSLLDAMRALWHDTTGLVAGELGVADLLAGDTIR